MSVRPSKWDWIQSGDEVEVQPRGGEFASAEILAVEESGSCQARLTDSGEEVTITSLRQVKMSEALAAERSGKPMAKAQAQDPGPEEFGIMELHRRTKELDPEGKGVSVLTLRKYIWDRPEAAERIPHRKVPDTARPGSDKAVFTEESVQAALDVKNGNAQKWGPLSEREKKD